MNFFRSEDDIRAWHEANPDVGGAALTIGEAFRLGTAIFGDLMEGDAATAPGGRGPRVEGTGTQPTRAAPSAQVRRKNA